jgi:hypothetical protein
MPLPIDLPSVKRASYISLLLCSITSPIPKIMNIKIIIPHSLRVGISSEGIVVVVVGVFFNIQPILLNLQMSESSATHLQKVILFALRGYIQYVDTPNSLAISG